MHPTFKNCSDLSFISPYNSIYFENVCGNRLISHFHIIEWWKVWTQPDFSVWHWMFLFWYISFKVEKCSISNVYFKGCLFLRPVQCDNHENETVSLGWYSGSLHTPVLHEKFQFWGWRYSVVTIPKVYKSSMRSSNSRAGGILEWSYSKFISHPWEVLILLVFWSDHTWSF